MPSNRKLFFFTTSITTNDSVCPDNLCIDPDCPFSDCPSYPDPPSSSFFPPPDPPTPTTFSDQSFQLSPFVIIVIALISALLVLLIYYFALVKLCSDCLLLRRRTPHVRQNATEENDDVEIVTDDDEPQGPQIDHPIWLINTVGLQQSIINTITVVKYRRGEGLIEGTDCSVCLSEFQENETLRLLPKCSHAFHVGCIDTWLRSHTNCPMCRALITVFGNGGPSNPSSSLVDPEMSEIELTSNDIVNEESLASERVNLVVVDGSDGNKADTSFENGAKPIRRCISMSYRGDRNEYLDPLQGNRFCLRRSSSSGARLYM